MQAQMETGMPYMIYNTLGRINSNAHVCVEIIEHTSPGEPAVHFLASTGLSAAEVSHSK